MQSYIQTLTRKKEEERRKKKKTEKVCSGSRFQGTAVSATRPFKLEKSSWQQAKHAKLYFDLVQGGKEKDSKENDNI